MISKEQIATIRRLYYAEHWKIGTIAAALGLHPDTVKHACGAAATGPRHHRPRLTDPFLDFIHQTLQQYPRLRATRLFEMLRERGYQGSIYPLRRVAARLRPQSREAFLRLETFPGEQAQVDWASFGQVEIGRARRRLSCFVITLSYSRAIWLEFFMDQSLENFLLGHVHAFEDWGGAARILLYDNLRSAVLERFGDQVRLHPRLLDLCGHYHFQARPCQVGRGNEKGRVERSIRYIRDSFFAARSWTTIEDLNRQAKEWRDRIAHQRRWPGDDSRSVAEVFAEEKARLIPLPEHPFETDLVKTVRSGKTIYVRFDQNDYSIPHALVGQLLTLVATPEVVRILDGEREVARHRRSYDRHQRIEEAIHIAALVEQKRKARAATAAGRLSEAVSNIEEFLQAAFQRGESVARQSSQLLALLDDYSAKEVEAAVAEAIANNTPRAASVAFILNRRHRSRRRLPQPVDLSRHPQLADLSVPTHQLEVYDELSDDDAEN
jgi:transposase